MVRVQHDYTSDWEVESASKDWVLPQDRNALTLDGTTDIFNILQMYAMHVYYIAQVTFYH